MYMGAGAFVTPENCGCVEYCTLLVLNIVHVVRLEVAQKSLYEDPSVCLCSSSTSGNVLAVY